MYLHEDETMRIERALGQAVKSAERIQGRGYTNNRRWLVRLAHDRTAFVKHADDAITAEWLRREYEVYDALRLDVVPRVLGWYDDGELPVLVLEDLSDGDWSPPWSREKIDAVLATLRAVAGHEPPPGLPTARSTHMGEDNWPEVAADPKPFLSLGLCSADWLDRALPVLLEAARPEQLDGDSLLHLDVRSDNLCFRAGRAFLFDWNHAAIGNAQFDVAFWLPSLRLEGGPEPEEVADVTPELAALVAGFFAARAGLPVIPQAPMVRDIQRRQLEVALPWAARALGLPAPS
ncbi:aminoglycoside phosphotransferase family protein [Streptomyces chrestomyceticus]|uniref:aminoglycoside phosphotransferase family protein n=1 Tax=Streptomyces chrestomyceticus TaxID=68185 RepID=UPI00369D55D8